MDKESKVKKNIAEDNGNYDWFRGKVNNKNFSPKQKIFNILKILKICLFVLLAAFSLTGCIQGFIIKTASQGEVGVGLEMYSKKENVAPHVETIKVMNNGELIISSKERYWLNRYESDPEVMKSNVKTLDIIQKQVGEGYFTWATENNAIRFEDENGLGISEFGQKGNKNSTLFTVGQNKNSEPIYAIVGDKAKNKGLENFIAPTTDIVTIPVFRRQTTAIKNDFTLIKSDVKFSAFKSTVKNNVAKKQNMDNAINQVIFKSYIAWFKTKSIYLDAMRQFKLVNNGNTTDATIAAIAQERLYEYQRALTTIKKIFGLGDIKDFTYNDSSKMWLKVQNPTGTISGKVKSSNGNDVVRPNIFTTKLSSGYKQRAIYNWSRSWILGPFYGFFVYPISKITLGISNGLPSASSWYGWETILTLFFSIFIVRLFGYALSFKSTLQQVKQQELSSKRAAIEAKYTQYKGNKQMEQRKRQEMSEMFKKEGVSPLGSMGGMFVTMPIFLSMWKIIGGLPHFKSTSWLGINFSQTSWRELMSGSWQYLPLMLFAGGVQTLSVLLPRFLTKKRDKNRMNAQQKEALKKTNKTQNIMAAVFVVMAIIMSAGTQIYWIFGGIFTTIQNIVNHFIIKTQSKKKKTKKIKI